MSVTSIGFKFLNYTQNVVEKQHDKKNDGF